MITTASSIKTATQCYGPEHDLKRLYFIFSKGVLNIMKDNVFININEASKILNGKISEAAIRYHVRIGNLQDYRLCKRGKILLKKSEFLKKFPSSFLEGETR